MKIALTYNLKVKDASKPADYASEYDSEETINAIIDALRKNGHQVEPVEVSSNEVFGILSRHKVDMVFNIAEGKHGRFRESEIPAILDYLNIPYTGSNTIALAIALNKALTKKILKAEGIPTPAFQLFSTGKEQLNTDLRFPLIVKPNFEGSAKGITRASVVYKTEDLYKRVREIIETYQQEALVEEFIEGKELTVGVLENGKLEALPILEIDFSTAAASGEFFYSWRMKEFQGDKQQGLTPTFYCPARLDSQTEQRVKEIAIATHRAIGCTDISRTDIRLSLDNIPYVLEINPLPGLNPRESNFPLMAYAAGMKYEELIETIISSAQKRRKQGYGQ
ncbi:MAG: ATP-grasp domain-containing protein [Candidatus Omnitrophica bacterium]|nr:ATP-grasp domain-containing protein [Candidatus Omnitrophota bacterium]